MVVDYFQILVLRQWRSTTKSLAVVKNCNCTKEMSSLKPVSQILQQCLKEKEKGEINLQTLSERGSKRSIGERRREDREERNHISFKSFPNFLCRCYGDTLIFRGMLSINVLLTTFLQFT